MTKEEATTYIKEWLKDEYLDSKDRAALTTIIEESEYKCVYSTKDSYCQYDDFTLPTGKPVGLTCGL